MRYSLTALLFGMMCASGVAQETTPPAKPGHVPTITIQEHTVFDGNQGYRIEGTLYRLACGPGIVECPNGDLLCVWLSGGDSEPAHDNCSLMARSSDGGQTWSPPVIVAPAGEMAGCFGNLRRLGDKLVAFSIRWPSEKEYTEWHYAQVESRDNGHTWSEPVPFTFHDDHAAIVGVPLALSSGACLYGCCFFEKRPQPLTGPVSLLARAPDERAALAITELPRTPEERPLKFGTYLHGCSVAIAPDAASTEFTEYGHIANRPLGLLEPTVIELKNGTLVMLMRAEWGGCLWRSESHDQGRTWSAARPTEIPNPSALANLIRLPDGRIGLLHNPIGELGKWGARSPLALWISADEMETWPIRAALIAGGNLSYPYPILYRNQLWFAYDKNRREANVVQVSLSN